MNHSAFANFECIASGTLAEVYAAAGQDCQIFDHKPAVWWMSIPAFRPKMKVPGPAGPSWG